MKKEKILISGNEAIGEGAIQAGCFFYAGYPITPQNELTAYMAKRMLQEKRIFIQAESEVSAINMVLGASSCGFRAMTSSSSPGISLKQEGISYLAACQLPAVIVNIMRAGPGLGNVFPAQSDYFQATKGGGHGDYHSIVLAPSNIQEAFDFMFLAFDLADKYRNPVMILGDGILGQMMEPLRLSVVSGQLSDRYNLKTKNRKLKAKSWALTGCKKRSPHIIRSLYLKQKEIEELNLLLQKKYKTIKQKESRWQEVDIEDAKVIMVAYGTMARIAKGVVKKLREKNKKIGLIRPITLWPFPQRVFERICQRRIIFLVIEMSYGQMLEDVKLAVEGRAKVEFLGRGGGGIPKEQEILHKIESLKI
ncbi:MAG: 3-methyl-2-oxobutanoate dehydrogenase subunit VorB [Candidatus Omnitrophica bacterium]|nr:3-methyl-2-oxobutanoate dehydrogenase subunit VorB [Candidatus Omnitrophota bacterium]